MPVFESFLLFANPIVSTTFKAIVSVLAALFLHALGTALVGRLLARRIITQSNILMRTLAGAVIVLGISAGLMTFPDVRQVGTSLLASAGVAVLPPGDRRGQRRARRNLQRAELCGAGKTPAAARLMIFCRRDSLNFRCLAVQPLLKWCISSTCL